MYKIVTKARTGEQFIKNNQCSAKLCNTSQTFNNIWCPSWVCAYSAVTICASSLNSKRHLSGLYLGFWTVQFTWAVGFCFRARCVTCCGRTPMTAAGGGSLPEVPATPSVRTSLKPSIMPTDSLWCLAPISWSWRYFGHFFTARCHFYVKILCCLTKEWVWIFVYRKSPRGFALKKTNLAA